MANARGEVQQHCHLTMAGSHGESALEAIVLDGATQRVLQECQGDVLASLAAPLLAGRIG